MKKLPRSTARRSPCPIAVALDIMGDKWTLLLVRDMGLLGRHRNKDFQQGSEGIPSNILAHRLRTLHGLGLVKKIPYQSHPPRYEYHLTPAGQDLLPIIKAMAHWSSTHVAGIRIPDLPQPAASGDNL